MPVLGNYGAGLDKSMQTLLRKVLLPVAEKRMVLHNWAMTASEAKGTDVRRFNRLLKIARQTATYTPGTVMTFSDVTKKFVTNYLDITPLWHRDAVYIDEDVDVMSIINDKQKSDALATQFAESMEFLLAKTLHDESMWWRTDKDGASQINDTAASATSSQVVLTDSAAANDFWDEGQAVFYDPKLATYDEAAHASNWVQSGKVLTIAFTNTPEATGKLFMARKTGIVAGDTLSVTNMVDLAYLHDRARTPKFNGSTIRGVIAPENKADLMLDSDWKAYVQNDRSQKTENYEILRWFDNELLVSDVVLRTDDDNTANYDDGAVFCPVFFGRDSYAVHHWPSISGQNTGTFGVEFGIVGGTPDSGNITASKRAFWWKAIHGRAVLRATNVVTALCGATDRGFNTIT